MPRRFNLHLLETVTLPEKSSLESSKILLLCNRLPDALAFVFCFLAVNPDFRLPCAAALSHPFIEDEARACAREPTAPPQQLHHFLDNPPAPPSQPHTNVISSSPDIACPWPVVKPSFALRLPEQRAPLVVPEVSPIPVTAGPPQTLSLSYSDQPQFFHSTPIEPHLSEQHLSTRSQASASRRPAVSWFHTREALGEEEVILIEDSSRESMQQDGEDTDYLFHENRSIIVVEASSVDNPQDMDVIYVEDSSEEQE